MEELVYLLHINELAREKPFWGLKEWGTKIYQDLPGLLDATTRLET